MGCEHGGGLLDPPSGLYPEEELAAGAAEPS